MLARVAKGGAIAVAVLLGIVGLAALVGLALPADHSATRRARFTRTPVEVRRLEGERLLERIAGTAVALDERGKSLNSEKFAQWMAERRERAEDTTFVIGGAYGLDDVVRQRAGMLLSVSPWTLQHDMARLVLAEQLFRAGTIYRGEPYHKGD